GKIPAWPDVFCRAVADDGRAARGSSCAACANFCLRRVCSPARAWVLVVQARRATTRRQTPGLERTRTRRRVRRAVDYCLPHVARPAARGCCNVEVDLSFRELLATIDRLLTSNL